MRAEVEVTGSPAAIVFAIGLDCVFIYIILKGSFANKQLVNDAKKAARVTSFEEFAKSKESGKSCWGVFKITSRTSVKNAKYQIPNSVYGFVEYEKIHHDADDSWTEYITVWEDRVPQLYIDNYQVDTAALFNKVEIRTANRIKLDEYNKAYYYPTDTNYIVGYLSKNDSYIISTETSKTPEQIVSANLPKASLTFALAVCVTILIALIFALWAQGKNTN